MVLSRSGQVAGQPLRLTKTITLHGAADHLTAHYLLENCPRQQRLHFAVECNLAGLAADTDDRYFYHENTREIIGQRSRNTYRLGQKVRVLLDRIDPVEKKIQFAVLEEERRAKNKQKQRR